MRTRGAAQPANMPAFLAPAPRGRHKLRSAPAGGLCATRSRPICPSGAPLAPCAGARMAAEPPSLPDSPAVESGETKLSPLDSVSRGGYTMRARLREETEAPFRKARMFVYGGSAVSAGVGLLIAGLRVIAGLIGVSGVQPLNETLPNVAINFTVISVCVLLLRAENNAGLRRLERMSRGARLASLRVEDAATSKVLALKELRGRSRVVIVAGKHTALVETMAAAEAVRNGLTDSRLIIVPLVTEKSDSADLNLPRGSWIARPFARVEWLKWYKGEVEIARKKLSSKADDVLVVIIRLDGKVGARSVGPPAWQKLIDEIGRMTKTRIRDQYGSP